MMDRDEDIVMSGQRHPFLSRYKIGFTKEGKIVAVDITLYCNAGMSFDLSTAVSCTLPSVYFFSIVEQSKD